MEGLEPKNEGTEISVPSFVGDAESLTFDATATQLAPGRVSDIISIILRKRFPGEPMKQEVVPRGERLNISCPYCGDSTDARKKRGNFYEDGLNFKCYNGGCEVRVGLLKMVRDFGVEDQLMTGEATIIALARSSTSGSATASLRARSAEISLDAMTGADMSRVLIPRSALMERRGLWEVWENSPAGNYLTKRQQKLGPHFAWDNKRKSLVLFNLDSTGEFVFSAQVRPLGADVGKFMGPKYVTYLCDRLWREWVGTGDGSVLEAVAPVDHLSQFFGVLKVDFSKTVTIVEGPMDHFLLPNSVATCGTNFDWPFELDDDRNMQDNDAAGRSLAAKVLERGGKAFMWQRFLSANGMDNSVKDWNDVVVLCWKRGCPVPSVEDFFAADSLDLMDV